MAVLHFVGGDDAHEAVARYIGPAAPGSYLVLSHATGDVDPRGAAVGTSVYARTANPMSLRTREEILAFFDGLEILEPGLVPMPQWRPDEPAPADAGKAWMLSGIGRKLA